MSLAGVTEHVGLQFPPPNTERLGLGAAERGFQLFKAAHLASKIKTGFACVFLISAGAKHSLRSEQPQALETAQCIDVNLNFGKGRKRRLFTSKALGLSSPGAAGAECSKGRIPAVSSGAGAAAMLPNQRCGNQACDRHVSLRGLQRLPPQLNLG